MRFERRGGGYSLSYAMLYQLRFLVVTFVVLFMQDFNIITQMVTVGVSIFIIICLVGHVQPFIDKSRNRTEFLSEMACLCMLDLLFLSTNPALQVTQRDALGFMQIVVLGIYLALS